MSCPEIQIINCCEERLLELQEALLSLDPEFPLDCISSEGEEDSRIYEEWDIWRFGVNRVLDIAHESGSEKAIILHREWDGYDYSTLVSYQKNPPGRERVNKFNRKLVSALNLQVRRMDIYDTDCHPALSCVLHDGTQIHISYHREKRMVFNLQISHFQGQALLGVSLWRCHGLKNLVALYEETLRYLGYAMLLTN